MRKLSVLLLTILLLNLCLGAAAGAEGNLAAPFASGSGEAAMASRIAEILGTDTIPADDALPESERRINAANLMLADPGTLLCDTQAALIAALQGYTAEDFRSAMTPVCRAARCPLYLVMGKNTAAEMGIDGAESFLGWLAEHEYDDTCLLARHVEASPLDRAAVFLSEELPLLTDVFFPEQIPELIRSGEAALAVFTETEIEASAQDLLILFTLGGERTEAHPEVPSITESGFRACPEPALYLMAKSGTEEAFLQECALKISEADLSAVCSSAGYVFDPASGEALQAEIAGIFADYKDYMTAEGLYFYE